MLDALVVSRSREPGLPLDVDDAFSTESDPRGDPGRFTEPVVAEIVDGETVDLSDRLSLGRDVDDPVGDELVGPVFRQTVPPISGRIRGGDVSPADGLGTVTAGLKVRLSSGDQRDPRIELEKPPAPAAQVNRLFEHGGHAGSDPWGESHPLRRPFAAPREYRLHGRESERSPSRNRRGP